MVFNAHLTDRQDIFVQYALLPGRVHPVNRTQPVGRGRLRAVQPGGGDHYRDFFGFGSVFRGVFSMPTGHSVLSGHWEPRVLLDAQFLRMHAHEVGELGPAGLGDDVLD